MGGFERPIFVERWVPEQKLAPCLILRTKFWQMDGFEGKIGTLIDFKEKTSVDGWVREETFGRQMGGSVKP